MSDTRYGKGKGTGVAKGNAIVRTHDILYIGYLS
jgi:hypothetical protein